MPNTTFDEFSARFSDELSITLDITRDLKLSEIPEYDSMGKINISLLIEELFNFQIEYDHLSSADTLNTLYEICVTQGAND
jgi:acyl carrier protein